MLGCGWGSWKAIGLPPPPPLPYLIPFIPCRIPALRLLHYDSNRRHPHVLPIVPPSDFSGAVLSYYVHTYHSHAIMTASSVLVCTRVTLRSHPLPLSVETLFAEIQNLKRRLLLATGVDCLNPAFTRPRRWAMPMAGTSEEKDFF